MVTLPQAASAPRARTRAPATMSAAASDIDNLDIGLLPVCIALIPRRNAHYGNPPVRRTPPGSDHSQPGWAVAIDRSSFVSKGQSRLSLGTEEAGPCAGAGGAGPPGCRPPVLPAQLDPRVDLCGSRPPSILRLPHALKSGDMADYDHPVVKWPSNNKNDIKITQYQCLMTHPDGK